MTIHKTLLSEVETEERRYQNLQGIWSHDWRHSSHYMLMRSRGYIARKLTHFSLYFTETIGISLLANLTLVKASWTFLGISILLSLLMDHILQGSRFIFLNRRITPKQVLMLPAVAYTLALIVFGIQISGSFQSIDQIVIAMIVGGILGTITESVVEALTFRMSLTERIYFPPFLNYVVIAAALTIVTTANILSGIESIYLVIVGHASLRIIHSLTFLFYAYRKQNQFNQLKQNQRGSTNLSLNKDELKDAGRRVILLLSAWFQPGLLILASHNLSTALGFAGAWTVASLMSSIVERPYRAVLVDIMRALQLKQWRFVASQLRLSTRTSIALATAFTLTIFLAHTFLLETGQIFTVLWLTTLLFGRVILSRLLLLGIDDLVAGPLIIMRCIAAPLLWVLLRDDLKSLTASFAIIEICLLIWVYVIHNKIKVEEHLAFRHSLLSKDARNVFEALGSKDFLDAHSAWMMLNKQSQNKNLFLLTLRIRVSSGSAVDRLCKEIANTINFQSVVLSIDARKVVIWSLEPASEEYVTWRLMTAFPLLFSGIEKVSIDKLASVLLGNIREVPFNFDLYSFEGSHRARLLDQWTYQVVGNPLAGRWWVCDEEGKWQSSEGAAPPFLSGTLHGLTRRSYTQKLWIDPSFQRVSKSSHRFLVLHPFGEILAIYEADKTSGEMQTLFSKLCSQMIAARIRAKPKSNQEVRQEVYHWILSAASALSKSNETKLTEQQQRFSSSLANNVVWTKSGTGFNMCLSSNPPNNLIEPTQHVVEVTKNAA